jgi:hypothetical protein
MERIREHTLDRANESRWPEWAPEIAARRHHDLAGRKVQRSQPYGGGEIGLQSVHVPSKLGFMDRHKPRGLHTT